MYRLPIALAATAVLLQPDSSAQAQWGSPSGFSQFFNSFAPFDFDRDGDFDLIGPGRGFNEPLLYVENLGDGTFGTAVTVTPGEFRFASVTLADLTGDGVDDFVLGEDNGEISLVEVLGPNQVGATVVLATLPTNTFVRLGDLDGDGDLDIAATQGNGDQVVWLENEGAAGFGTPQVVTTAVDEPRRVLVVDVDGDGDLDIVSTSVRDDRLAWYPNDGAGVFGTQRLISTAADRVIGVAAGDLNGDGILDLVTASDGDKEVSYFQGNGGGLFASQLIVGVLSGTFFSVGVADVDNDGLLDIYSGSNASGSNDLRWFQNIGFGFFGPGQSAPGNLALGGVIQVFDVDQDSDPDFVYANGFTPQETDIGMVFCTSNANSTGVNGQLQLTGTPRRAANAITLNAFDLPLGTFGIFVTSRFAGAGVTPPGSQGLLCLTTAIGRYQNMDEIRTTGVTGRFKLTVDLDAMRQPSGNVVATVGQTWRFQAWHRDTVGGSPTSNFTDATSVVLQ